MRSSHIIVKLSAAIPACDQDSVILPNTLKSLPKSITPLDNLLKSHDGNLIKTYRPILIQFLTLIPKCLINLNRYLPAALLRLGQAIVYATSAA